MKMVWCERNRAKMPQKTCDRRRKEQQKLKKDMGHTHSLYKGIAYNGCKDCPGGVPIPESEVEKMTEEIEKGLETPKCSKCKDREIHKNMQSRKWSMDGESGIGLCWGCYDVVLKDEKARGVSKPRKSRKKLPPGHSSPPVKNAKRPPAPPMPPDPESKSKSILVTNKTVFKLLTGSYSCLVISSDDISNEVKAIIDEAAGLVEDMNEKGWGCELEVLLRIKPREKRA